MLRPPQLTLQFTLCASPDKRGNLYCYVVRELCTSNLSQAPYASGSAGHGALLATEARTVETTARRTQSNMGSQAELRHGRGMPQRGATLAGLHAAGLRGGLRVVTEWATLQLPTSFPVASMAC